MTNQQAMSEALSVMKNTLREHRERRQLEAYKNTIEILKTRKRDAVIETFCHGTGRMLLTENSIITIYKNPSDYPDKFVARIYERGLPTKYIALANTVEEIMEKIPSNKVFLKRSEKDDPVIVGVVVVPLTEEEEETALRIKKLLKA